MICPPCVRGACVNCHGAIGYDHGHREPCKCRNCNGFGLPRPEHHGGHLHVCTRACWGR